MLASRLTQSPRHRSRPPCRCSRQTQKGQTRNGRRGPPSSSARRRAHSARARLRALRPRQNAWPPLRARGRAGRRARAGEETTGASRSVPCLRVSRARRVGCRARAVCRACASARLCARSPYVSAPLNTFIACYLIMRAEAWARHRGTNDGGICFNCARAPRARTGPPPNAQSGQPKALPRRGPSDAI